MAGITMTPTAASTVNDDVKPNVDVQATEQNAPSETPTAPEPDTSAVPEAPKPTWDKSKGVDDNLAAAGFDTSAIAKEYADNGYTLTDATIENIANTLGPKAALETVKALEGELAKIRQQDEEVVKTVGGKSEWDKLSAWAQQNMSKEELQAVNNLLSGNSLELKKLAIKAVHSQYKQIVGVKPNLMQGTHTPTTTEKALSFTEWHKLTRTEKYRRDVKYRNMVDNQYKMHSDFTGRQ